MEISQNNRHHTLEHGDQSRRGYSLGHLGAMSAQSDDHWSHGAIYFCLTNVGIPTYF